MRELLSKVEGGCISARFHMASSGSGLGPSEGAISGKLDWFLDRE